MTLTAIDIVLCLLVAALIGAVGYLFGRITAELDGEHQAPNLKPPAPVQTFDQWRMTGHQPRPAITRAPDPTPAPAPLFLAANVIALYDTFASLALADRRQAGHRPELAAAPEPDAERHKVTSPDLMALDVEAMIARTRREIDELVDDAERTIGELAHA